MMIIIIIIIMIIIVIIIIGIIVDDTDHTIYGNQTSIEIRRTKGLESIHSVTHLGPYLISYFLFRIVRVLGSGFQFYD